MHKLTSLIIIVLVAISVGAAAYFGSIKNKPVTRSEPVHQAKTPALADISRSPSPSASVAPALSETWVDVRWESKLLEKEIPPCDQERNNYKCPVKTYKAGTITKGEYAGYDLYLGGIEGMGIYYEYYLLDKGDILYFQDKKISVHGIDDVPESIPFPDKPGYVLKKGYIASAFFSELSLGQKVFTDPTLGDFYLEKKGGCFVVELPDHRTIAYNLDMPFVNEENGAVSLTFNTGEANTEAYEFTIIRGCGALCRYLHVVDGEDGMPVERLTVVGKTANGEDMYGIRDPEDSRLKTLYDDKGTVAYYTESYGQLSKNKYIYRQFLAYHPFLYWKDPLGRWVEFRNTRFIIAAEMCKPVIYLYPEKTTRLTVAVHPNGGITYSNPPYRNGWRVEAYQDGSIVDLDSGKRYDYLFWEGIGLHYPVDSKGWVIKQEDLNAFFDEKLVLLGLQGRELADFKAYWINRLTDKPYYKLSFLTKGQFDELAPLEISHPVGRVIRIMMTAQGLDAPLAIEPQDLERPAARQGFTVIEWGGVVLR